MPSSAGSPEAGLPPLVVICGPTATGKTALSLALAERLPGAEIISADSRQVYRGMDIGTAKVSAADRARVPHHGLDLVDPDQPFNAADYRAHAMAALRGIAERGGVAILVGGTGLYIRAVARDVPLEEEGSSPQLRARLEGRLAGEGLHTLVAELRSRAPTIAARTDTANPRRVVRALERAELGGDRLPSPPRGYPAPSTWIGLDTAIPIHNRWIEERARWQFENGLLEETATLRDRHDTRAPSFSALGYAEGLAVLDGRMTTDAAIATDVRRTRQLARRQRTWFRSEPGVTWLEADDDPLPQSLAAASRLLGA